MNSFIDDFQIAALIIAVLVVTAKALYLRLVRKINPIVIGSGKKGFSLAVELIAVVGLLIWMIEVLMYSLHLSFRILPWPLDIELLNSLLAKVIGVVLITIGLVIFVLAYCSFGDSWRVGF